MVARGMENKEIAKRLGITEQAVKEHVSTLLRNLGVRNRAALAEAATTHRLTGRFDEVLDAISTGVAVVDSDGNVLHINTAARRLLNMTEVPVRLTAELIAPLERALRGEEVREPRVTALPLRRPDGTVRGAVVTFAAA